MTRWVCQSCGYETTFPRHGRDATHVNGTFFHRGCEKTEDGAENKFKSLDKQEPTKSLADGSNAGLPRQLPSPKRAESESLDR